MDASEAKRNRSVPRASSTFGSDVASDCWVCWSLVAALVADLASADDDWNSPATKFEDYIFLIIVASDLYVYVPPRGPICPLRVAPGAHRAAKVPPSRGTHDERHVGFRGGTALSGPPRGRPTVPRRRPVRP